MFDVFLSHNKQQKPWVRRLYKFLRDNGLNVFFDEESIAPGENIVTAIENGLANSRHVLLVLSTSSLSSEWVAMETQIAIHGDPSAQKQRLIPIIIEDVNSSSIRPTVRSLNCIDLNPISTREFRLRLLLRHLGIPNADTVPTPHLDGLLSLDDSDPSTHLRIADINDIVIWGWDGTRLLEELIKLDYATIDNLTHVHEGDPEQWGPVFMNHPETWRLLIDTTESIAGYWHIAPLFSPEYELAKTGQLLDSQITVDTLQFFELQGIYDVYFVQVCLHPKHRQLRNTKLLFESFFEVLDKLSAEGILVREVTANAFTQIGISLCRTFHMNRLCDHSNQGTIYSAPIKEMLKSPLAERFPGIKPRYAKVGLL